MARERNREPEAVRITSAAASRREEIASREKRYVLSMGIRTACFIGAVTAYLTTHLVWLWAPIMVAAVVLPYVAVVMANAAHTKGDSVALLDQGPGHRQLGPGEDGP
jgi:hypothetical protein